ncbi:MAG: TRAP transporter large permease [Betaproteobacteria bacterium]|nr:TRAP transporter large permease [Betaproteobacteria bacterium]
MDLLILFAAFFGSIFLGLTVTAAIALVTVVGFGLLDVPLLTLITRTFGGIDSTPLLTLPFYVLAGELMYRGGIIEMLIRFVDGLIGWVRGGLAYVNVLVSLIFSGPSGSTVSDTAAVGAVMIPAMIKKGYDADFAVAVTVASSTMAPLIPPSILMIVYAHIAHVSIGQLFLAGVVPGLFVAICVIAFVWIVVRVRGYQAQEARRPWRETGKALLLSFDVIVLPLVVVLGIRFGLFTPTEAAIVCVWLVAFSTIVIRRTVKLRDIPGILLSAAASSAMVMIIIGLSTPLGDALSRMNFQDSVLAYLLSFSTDRWVILSLVLAFIVLLGTVVEGTAICIMFASVFSALGTSLGFDPIHFGVLMVFAMIISSITPPVAISLFVAVAIAKISVRKVEGLIWLFMPALLFALLLTVLFPELVLWLPRHSIGR